MSQCKIRYASKRGKPKTRHATREEAEAHAKWHQKSTLHKVDVYKCSNCGFWHVGRVATIKRIRVEMKKRAAQEDYLVGKLIQAIKESIGGPGYRAR